VADADLTRQLTQRQVLDAALADGPLGGLQERLAEIAVVIGAVAHALKPSGQR
jgi:hypothetical protein